MKPGRGPALVVAVVLLVAGCGVTPGAPSSAGASGPNDPGASAAALQGSSAAASTPEPTVGPTPLPDGVLASIALERGSAPSAIVAAYGSIWVESHRGTILYRIDPATDTVVARIDVGQESCGTPGTGAGRIWVMPCGDGTKTVIVDPATNQIVGSLQAGSLSMAFTKGSVWIGAIAHDGTLLRVDPTTLRTLSTIPAGHGLDSVVTGAGYVWVADAERVTGDPDVISKIDPDTGRVIATVSGPDPGRGPALLFAFGSLWLKGIDDNRLIKIDPASGKVTTYAIAGWAGGLNSFYDIVPTDGLGSLWMRIANAVVVRVDPTDGSVLARYPADPVSGGGYVAVAFGSLWVANFGTDTVWRVRIQE